MRIDRETGSYLSKPGSRTMTVLCAAMAAGILVSCASVTNPPGTVTAQFFQNPDRVWDGIEISLDTLGYEIESSNRADGVIRALPTSESATPGAALEINQIMNTDDEVRVYVRPVAADAAVATVQEELDRAARDFVTVLKRKLGG